MSLGLSACGGPEEQIVLGEGNWNSFVFHNQVAKIIIEQGYDYSVDIVPADTNVLVPSLKEGDVDIAMEIWSDNIPTYEDDIANGEYIELSTNFDDNRQGLYIPAYLQEEYPGLVSVQDLPDYAHLFPNPEGGDKSVIYGGPEGWSATTHLHDKMEAYSLDDDFAFKTIDSSATLNASLAGAYANEEPWVGYNWEPTWALGMYDMVLLEDSAYNADDFADGVGSFPSVDVNVVVNTDFADSYPELNAFLSDYETTSAITSEALAYMQDNDDDTGELAAIYFLTNYENLWSEWVTDEAYDNVMEYINNQ